MGPCDVTYRNKQLLAAANGAACVKCGRKDGTVVAAHYFGPRRGTYGGGLGIKVHDFLVAHLCGKCHLEMDQLSRDKNHRWEHSEEFLHYIALTLHRCFDDGTIQVMA